MKTQKIKLTEEQLKELIELKDNKECTANELKRVQAILLVDSGAQSKLIEQLTGYGKKYAFDLRKKYIDCGISTLKDKRKPPERLLTKNQREQIITILHKSTPEAFGYNSSFWTTSILAHLIKEQYGVQYKSKTSFYIIFKNAKFTYHKPDKQYKNRDQKVIDEWTQKHKQEITDALNDPNTVVLVEDEMFLTTQTTTQKIWLPKGEFPKIDVSSKRQLRCIYGFLNVSSGKEHAFKTTAANSDETCKILNLIGNEYKNYKIVIIWDNAIWHKSLKIKSFLSETKHKLHLITLPPYAPDLNPQENVWKAGRSNVSHNQFIDNIDTATDEFVGYLGNQIFDYKFLTH